MVKYVKLIDKYNIEEAPINKGNIINYYLNTDMVKEDGYMQLVEFDVPSTNKQYRPIYVQEEQYIVRKWEEIKEKPALSGFFKALSMSRSDNEEERKEGEEQINIFIKEYLDNDQPTK